MVRTGILTTAVAIALSGLLFAQGQPQKKDAASQWSFAYAETSTQLVTLTPQPEVAPSQARNLAWAVCPGAVTAISFVPNASVSRGHRYVSAESVPPGTHCLLIDSASHDAMFYWQRGSEIFPVKRACVKGFPQAAEALTGRKVDSCYVIGGYGTGAVELIKYTGQSPKDGLAALLLTI